MRAAPGPPSRSCPGAGPPPGRWGSGPRPARPPGRAARESQPNRRDVSHLLGHPGDLVLLGRDGQDPGALPGRVDPEPLDDRLASRRGSGGPSAPAAPSRPATATARCRSRASATRRRSRRCAPRRRRRRARPPAGPPPRPGRAPWPRAPSRGPVSPPPTTTRSRLHGTLQRGARRGRIGLVKPEDAVLGVAQGVAKVRWPWRSLQLTLCPGTVLLFPPCHWHS